MPFVLDPDDLVHAIEDLMPLVILPQAVRAFGFIPDIDLWMPGDLLLFSSVKPDWIKKAITRAQARGWNPDHARWHHAAVYIGRSQVCEATMGRVKLGSVYEYVPNHLIRVRRCPGLDLVGSHDLVVAALMRLNRGYSLTMAASVWWTSLSGTSKFDFAMGASHAHICSHLFADSYSQATGEILETVGIPTPASLSASTKLVDVDSRWKRLAS